MRSRIPDLGLVILSVSVCACENSRAEDYLPARRVCRVSDGRVSEASGITPSLRRKGVCWTLNDSGDPARIFAFRLEDGEVIAEVAVSGASAVDWECIDSGPGPIPDRSYLYIGDTGNNALNRANLRIYRIPEPELSGLEPGQKLSSDKAEKLRFQYPDGSLDCEAIAVHPRTGEIYLFSKRSAPSGVYRLASLVDDGKSHLAEKVGTLSVPNVVTAAAFSPDGLRLAIRTYAGIHEMTVLSKDAKISDFLAKAPSAIPPPPEYQGEAIAYAADGSGILTVSEGRNAPVYFLARKDAAPGPKPETKPEDEAKGVRPRAKTESKSPPLPGTGAKPSGPPAEPKPAKEPRTSSGRSARSAAEDGLQAGA